jgi:hypothetical protein
MRSAVSYIEWVSNQETAYLHRQTGEIIFLFRDEETAESWWGPPTVPDHRANRERREAGPHDWITIPKNRNWRYVDEDDFIREIFEEHGYLPQRT